MCRLSRWEVSKPLPVMIAECEIPPLLRDRLYADFREDYDGALQSVIAVINQPAGAFALELLRPSIEPVAAQVAEQGGVHQDLIAR